VVVAPRASELILPVSVAVEQRLRWISWRRRSPVYPSLSGSLSEAARKLMRFAPDFAYARGDLVRIIRDLELVLTEPGDPDVVGVGDPP